MAELETWKARTGIGWVSHLQWCFSDLKWRRGWGKVGWNHPRLLWSLTEIWQRSWGILKAKCELSENPTSSGNGPVIASLQWISVSCSWAPWSIMHPVVQDHRYPMVQILVPPLISWYFSKLLCLFLSVSWLIYKMVIIAVPLLSCALNEMSILSFFSETLGPASTNFFRKLGDPDPSYWLTCDSGKVRAEIHRFPRLMDTAF